MKKKKKIVLLAIFIFFLCFCLYFISINKNISKFAPSDKTNQIEETKKYGDTIIGWLTVEGTNIDLPLVKDTATADVPEREYNNAWVYSSPDSRSNHVSFVSHNIRNVSKHPIVGDTTMTGFEQLMSFIYKDFTAKNQYIAYTNEKGNTDIYRIYAVALLKNNQSAAFKDTYTESEQDKYIKESMNESMFDIDVSVNKTDKLLSLMTCTRFYGGNDSYTFRVDARKLRFKEKQKLAKVKTNKNYEKINNILEEGVTDEEI